jgi:uncharacterized OB-fold protein
MQNSAPTTEHLEEDRSQFLSPGSLSIDADGKPHLLGSCCRSCGLKMFPSGAVCPACMSEDLIEEAMPDQGTLYSFTVVHVGSSIWLKPLAVGYVDLPNGVRIFTHLRGDVTIGQTVTLALDTVGRALNGHELKNFVFRGDTVQ